MATFDPGEDGLLFHQQDGQPVRRQSGSRYMRMASDRAGLERHGWHDLRHHHASVLLSEGVSPALVAERLGHSITELLNTYAHVIRKDEDRVRTIVDNTLGGSAEDWLRTEAG
jgi:site-specific recombinase XerD